MNKPVSKDAMRLDSLRFGFSYQGTNDLAIDLSMYVVDESGHLLGVGIIWQRKSTIHIPREHLEKAIFFVGMTVDLADQCLTNFKLFGARGFLEVCVTFDAVNQEFVTDSIPEFVWRQWISDSPPTRRNELLWHCGGALAWNRVSEGCSAAIG
jgi:hypothetical protein